MLEIEIRSYLSFKVKILEKLLKKDRLSSYERLHAEIVVSYLKFCLDNLDCELGIINKYFHGSLHKSFKNKKPRSSQDRR